MKVIFKDVGQGDSIILEWRNSIGQLHIGLIDCNLKGVANPVLDYFKTLDDFVFDFLILSHPHDDHFSGILEVLEYLESTGSYLNYFLHTCASQKAYLTASVRTITHKSLLREIFRKANALYKAGQIRNYGAVNNVTKEFELAEDIFLKFLGPTQSQYDKFNARAFKNTDLTKNNPDANWLCTLIKVYSKDWYIFLTSDAPYDIFWDYHRKGKSDFKGSIIIGQIPHHGSEHNFYGGFWKTLEFKKSPFSCISVGPNTYGHPSEKVIAELKSIDYQVESTYSLRPAEFHFKTTSLDLVSTLVSSARSTSQDLGFSLGSGDCAKI